MNSKTLLLFDLDGTLWDSSLQVTEAWNLCFRKLGLQAITREMMRSNMGRQFIDVLREWLPEKTEKEREHILMACAEEEIVYLRSHPGILYPDIPETLRSLQDRYAFGIVSNCESGYIELFLDLCGFPELFADHECSGDTHLSKGKNIRLVMNRCGAEKCLYIGDMQGDADAAEEAGIPFIHAAYGFGSVRSAFASISYVAELPDVLP